MLCSRNTTHSMITKYKKTRCIANLVGRGRKRKATIRIDYLIQWKIKASHRKSVSSTKHETIDDLKIAISSQTVRHRARELGLHERVARRKPYLNEANPIKRLNYVKMYQDKEVAF